MKRIPGSGFTLVELLVVMTIIGIILAVLVPTLVQAPKAASYERAKIEVSNLDMALKMYEQEYRAWPAGKTEGTFTRDIVEILRGLNAPTTKPKEGNPNKRLFIDTANLSTNVSGSLVDPWNREYAYAVDNDYDNKILNAAGETVEGRSTAVWSSGPDGNTPIRSW